jgi:uncharacterized repeat protein (TIGR03803 family)
MMMRLKGNTMKRSRWCSAVVSLGLLTGCGGGSSGGGSVMSPTPSTTPTPSPTPTPTPTPTASISFLHIFGVGETDGFQPNGPPLQASDGNFYGTTRNGGANTCRPVSPIPCGVIFRITPTGEESVLHTFGAAATDGYSSLSALIQGGDGALYGTTSNGGAYGGGGTVFRISLDGSSYRTIYSFSGANGEGDTLPGSLVFGKDGNLYGVTSSGGANHCTQIPRAGPNCGTVFKLTPSGTLTTLQSFGRTATDGVQPNGPLVQTSEGSFYGTTGLGGANDRGTIFRISPDGNMSIIYSFGGTTGGPSTPQGSLLVGADGALYGTTPSGGAGACQYGCGVVYRLDPATAKLTIVYAFGRDGINDGRGPSAFLAVGRDGNLYGTTRSGGANGGGTAFRLTLGSTISTLFAFGPIQKQPYDPEMGLIEGQDGALYGMTFYNEGLGGVGNRPGFGAMYKLTIR